jgi:hypothetical protein
MLGVQEYKKLRKKAKSQNCFLRFKKIKKTVIFAIAKWNVETEEDGRSPRPTQ